MRKPTGRVENYTNAFLAVSGLILFMTFWTLAATKGMIWVLIVAAFMDWLIRLSAARISARRTG